MSGSSKYRLSVTDGLPCRVSGEWAKEKLHYLSHYMAIFNRGMKNLWPHRAYLDLMAGPGRCVLEDADQEFDGSPLLALHCSPEFGKVVLVEASAKLLKPLRARTESYGDRAHVLEGDCNSPSTVANIRNALPTNALTLAFADMLGLEVEFETLRQLTTRRKIDLAITFQVNDLVRNVPQILQERSDGGRLDRFFGNPDWRKAVADAESGKLTSTAIGDALTDFYVARLGTLGYEHVAPLHVLMKNTQNAPLYRLVLAGKHERATDFFRKISRIEYSGQRRLFK
jgi:three-Cys-motif partner protein